MFTCMVRVDGCGMRNNIYNNLYINKLVIYLFFLLYKNKFSCKNAPYLLQDIAKPL